MERVPSVREGRQKELKRPGKGCMYMAIEVIIAAAPPTVHARCTPSSNSTRIMKSIDWSYSIERADLAAALTEVSEWEKRHA